MALFTPWLTVAYNRNSAVIMEYKRAFEQLALPPEASPTLTMMVSRRMKSELLRNLITGPSRSLLSCGHAQAYLWQDTSSKSELPAIYVDYELQSNDPARLGRPVGTGPSVRRTIDLLSHRCEHWSRKSVGNLLCGCAIAPLCDTLCYFASDLGGIRPVATLLAEQLCHATPAEMPRSALPRVLVVVETSSSTFDPYVTESRITDMINTLLHARKNTEEWDTDAELRKHFHDIRVLGVAKRARSNDKFAHLRKRLTSIRREVSVAKSACGLRFERGHFQALVGRLLDHFHAGRTTPFSFVAATRPKGFCSDEFSMHFRELLSLIPAEVWLWHLVVPLVSSSILLASYPPGAPSKSLLRPRRSELTHHSVANRNGFLS